MTLSKSLRIQALDELQSTQCDCGNAKVAKQSFCRKCYFSLPKTMQQALYKGFGGGYEDAWDEARDYLRQERKAKS